MEIFHVVITTVLHLRKSVSRFEQITDACKPVFRLVRELERANKQTKRAKMQSELLENLNYRTTNNIKNIYDHDGCVMCGLVIVKDENACTRYLAQYR